MTDYIATQSGNWNDAATWGGSGYPQSSLDTATIGAFTVTIPTAISITCGQITQGGNSGTWAVLQVDGTLTQDGGPITLNHYSDLHIGAGGTLDLNGNNIEGQWGSSNIKLSFLGAESNRCTLTSSVAGTGDIKSYLPASEFWGALDFQYCDIVDIGAFTGGRASSVANSVNIRDTVFVDPASTPTLGGARHPDADFKIERCDIRGNATTPQIMLSIINRPTALGAGVLSLDSLTFYREGGGGQLRTTSNSVQDIVLTNCVFDDVTLQRLATSGAGNTIQRDNLMRLSSNAATVGSSTLGECTIDQSYLVMTGDNPHTVDTSHSVFTDNVIEALYASFSDHGDHFVVSDKDATVAGNVILEEKSGVFINAVGYTRTGNYTVNHNTVVGNYNNSYGALCRDESGGVYAGTLNLYSNIVYNKTPFTGSIGFNMTAANQDQVTAMNNNNWHQIDNRYSGVTSATKTAGVTADYGDQDTAHDPQFLDSTRNIAQWDLIEGTGAGTVDAAVSELIKINGYNATLKTQVPAEKTTHTVVALHTWVRDGFAPTNAALQGAAHDSGDVGAIPYVSSAIELAGASVSVSTPDATIVTSLPLAAISASSSFAEGALNISTQLQGNAVAQAVVSAILGSNVPVTAGAVSESLANATLTVSLGLNGNSVSESGADGSLTTDNSVALVGAIQSESGAGVDSLLFDVPLQGASVTQTSADGLLTSIVPLIGSSASINSVVGNLDVGLQFDGNAVSESLAQGVLTVRTGFDGQSISEASANGLLNFTGVHVAPQSRTLNVQSENRVLRVA